MTYTLKGQLAVSPEGRVMLNGEHTGVYLEPFDAVSGKVYDFQITPKSVLLADPAGKSLSSEELDQLTLGIRHLKARHLGIVPR